jgi:hypothetical protein
MRLTICRIFRTVSLGWDPCRCCDVANCVSGPSFSLLPQRWRTYQHAVFLVSRQPSNPTVIGQGKPAIRGAYCAGRLERRADRNAIFGLHVALLVISGSPRPCFASQDMRRPSGAYCCKGRPPRDESQCRSELGKTCCFRGRGSTMDHLVFRLEC